MEEYQPQINLTQDPIEVELMSTFEDHLNSQMKNKGVQQNLISRLAQSLFRRQPKQDTQPAVNYLQKAKELLFDSDQPDSVMRRIWDDNLTLGVCAKPLKSGVDVAWKCEDCEKDPTCIICKECFEKSDHTGHRVWLKTNVSGCCDCGDPEAWDPKGCCPDHQGIDSSRGPALAKVPTKIVQNAPKVFKCLTKILKGILLSLIEFKENSSMKALFEEMIAKFIDEMDKMLAQFKQSIFFLSEAYTEIFFGSHDIQGQKTTHTCCHRYFPTDADRIAHEQAVQAMGQPETGKYCSCSVIDLICQADQIYSKALRKKVSKQFMCLFQSYKFKEHLCFSYIANMQHFVSEVGDAKGIHSLGVQILTMDSVTSRILQDRVLYLNLTKVLQDTLAHFIANPSDNEMYVCFHLAHDFKYVAKPALMPQLLGQTVILDEMLEATSLFLFKDLCEMPKTMDMYGQDVAIRKYLQKIQTELTYTSIIEKFLQFVNKPADIERLLTAFSNTFAQFDEDFREKIGPGKPAQGFFQIPVHRLFSFMMTRLFMKDLIMRQVASAENMLAPEFNLVLSRFIDPETAHRMLDQVLTHFAVNMGYMAEIIVGKWVYKGEQWKTLINIYKQQYTEIYLKGIAIFQMSICAGTQQYPGSDYVDILINNFGTDDWVQTLLHNFESVPAGNASVVDPTLFKTKTNFHADKLAGQLQQLFIKLIEIATTEASFLIPASKQLFTREGDETLNKEQHNARFAEMYKNHLRREVMHVLFSQGANTSFEQIKKASQECYLKADAYTQTILEMSTQKTDQTGKKSFRMTAGEKYEAMFDPYYIISSKQQSQHQTSYENFYKTNPNCNNIVGDYKGNFKYSTLINQTCCEMFAKSATLVRLICHTLRECLLLQQAQDAQDPEAKFRADLFPQATLNMALKLLIIICQNIKSDQNIVTQIQPLLPQQLLMKTLVQNESQDAKMKEIGAYLIQLAYPEQDEEAKEILSPELIKKSSVLTEGEMEKKKTLEQKRKQILMAKFKAKRDKLLAKKSKEEPVEDQGQDQEQTKKSIEIGISCASCQEQIDIKSFYQRPFVQLCYLHPTKTLYYTYYQTYQSQLKSLKNQQAATLGLGLQEESKTVDEESKEREQDTNELWYKSQPWLQRDALVLDELQLRGVIDEKHMTGVSQSKCCHYFHHDCMTKYIESEQKADQQDFQRARIRDILSNESNVIQCPMCKSAKNTYQPFFPLGLEPDAGVAQSVVLDPYVDYCSQLTVTQLNNSGVNFDPQRGHMKSLLAVDIEKSPEDFVSQMMSAVSHLVMASVTLNNNSLLTAFDPSVQQNSVVLRDIVFVLLTVRELVSRICSKEKLQEISTSLLLQLTTKDAVPNVAHKNFSKIVVQLLFLATVKIDKDNVAVSVNEKDAIVQATYAAFKSQVVLTELFRKGFGEVQRDSLAAELADKENQMEISSFQDSTNDESVERQLNFIRAASAMCLCFDAVVGCITKKIDLESSQAAQLCLDMNLIDSVREQFDDQAQFQILINYLKLDSSLQLENVHKVPQSIKSLQSVPAQSIEAYLSVSGLNTDLNTHVQNLVKPEVESPGLAMAKERNTIQMPKVLHLLWPNFTFSFIDLPADYLTLTKNYYDRQCRFCHQQLQQNAICLLCGEVVCRQISKEACCQGLPGQLTIKNRQNFFSMLPEADKKEGCLSYHARMFEGGCSVFLIPQTAQIYMIDSGRAATGDSPYRNNLGETFKAGREKKWDNYFLNDETGGAKILENLRKLYLNSQLPAKIIQERMSKGSVIIRHAM